VRPLAIFCLPLIALAIPAIGLAAGNAAGDGTLVVSNGGGPKGVAVIRLVLDGATVAHLSTGSPDQIDTVIIDDPNNTNDIAASATAVRKSYADPTTGDSITKLQGSDFRFRAAGGLYKITIYGSGVDLFAVGQGKVELQGQPVATTPDGRYSINGADFHSLPAALTDWLTIKSAG
jgi:hypothetical protein